MCCSAKYNRPPTSAIRESLTTKRGGYGQRRLFLKDGQQATSSSPQQPYEFIILANAIKMLFIRAGTLLFGKIYNWLQICTDLLNIHRLKIQCMEHSTYTQNNLLKPKQAVETVVKNNQVIIITIGIFNKVSLISGT